MSTLPPGIVRSLTGMRQVKGKVCQKWQAMMLLGFSFKGPLQLLATRKVLGSETFGNLDSTDVSSGAALESMAKRKTFLLPSSFTVCLPVSLLRVLVTWKR